MSVLAPFSASILPIRVDPVNDTFLIRGLDTSSSPMACRCLSVVTTLSTPSGTPARLASCHLSVCRMKSRNGGTHLDDGEGGEGSLGRDLDDCRAASGEDRADLARAHRGREVPAVPQVSHTRSRQCRTNGTSSAQTPMGCLMVKFRVPGKLQGTVFPSIRTASPANQPMKLAAYVASAMASVHDLPFSHTMRRVMSSRLACMSE